MYAKAADILVHVSLVMCDAVIKHVNVMFINSINNLISISS